jgi:cell division protein FtsB
VRSFLPYLACSVLFAFSPHGRLAASDDEKAQLRQRAQQLEAETKALREEVSRLKNELTKVPGGKSEEARLATDLRLLLHLAKALEKEPKNLDLRLDTAALAKRLAPRSPSRLVWDVLLKTQTLKDGVSIEEAEKTLGPPTERSDSHIGWYFNPTDRHVAPYLRAKLTKEGLADWKLANR